LGISVGFCSRTHAKCPRGASMCRASVVLPPQFSSGARWGNAVKDFFA
jgi:hypothetical protein